MSDREVLYLTTYFALARHALDLVIFKSALVIYVNLLDGFRGAAPGLVMGHGSRHRSPLRCRAGTAGAGRARRRRQRHPAESIEARKYIHILITTFKTNKFRNVLICM